MVLPRSGKSLEAEWFVVGGQKDTIGYCLVSIRLFTDSENNILSHLYFIVNKYAIVGILNFIHGVSVNINFKLC